jgi:serine/threonine protein phosphatase 1
MSIRMTLGYPIIAIGDLHGQRHELQRLIDRLEKPPEWDACSLVFLGVFVDRGHDVGGPSTWCSICSDAPPVGRR